MDSDTISTLGPSVLDTTELIHAAGITADTFSSPVNVQKAKEIIEFLHGIPEKGAFIRRSGIARSENKLDRLYEYVSLHKNVTKVKKQLAELEDSISRYER